MLEPVEGEENRYLIMEEGKQPFGDTVEFGALVCKDDEIPLTLKDSLVGMARKFERRNDYQLTMEVQVLHDDLLLGLELTDFDAGFFIAPFQHEIQRDADGKPYRLMTYGRVRSVALLPPVGANPGARLT